MVEREELIALVEAAFQATADRLRAQGHEDPWPEDLRARDLVRLLRERSREVIARAYQEG